MSEIKHTPGQMHAVRDALAASLGDTYDCTRVWSAWDVGTMSQDDFVPINEDDDRLHELTIAALDASGVADLLEALNVMVKRIEYYSSLKDDERPNIEQWEYTEGSSDMANARAALAKATGSAS